MGFSGAFFKKPPEWGMGQRPIELEEARGAAPNPASFLKRKRERRIAENDVFGRGNYRFLRKCTSAWRENMRFSGNTFPLAGEIRDFPEMHFRLARKMRVFLEARRLAAVRL